MASTSLHCVQPASTSLSAASRASRPALRRACRVHVKAALWQPNGQEQPKAKGYDRPWIQANGQPILAPRTADMQGDPFGLLLRQRIVFLGGEVEDFGADAIISQLLLLDSQDQSKDIKMFINSPGAPACVCMPWRHSPSSRLDASPFGTACDPRELHTHGRQ